MRFNRTLTFGILGCLLAGILIGASQATIEGTLDDSPMSIPVSRVGDKVTYVWFERPNDMPDLEAEGSVTVSAGGPVPSFLSLDEAGESQGGHSGGSISGATEDGDHWTRAATFKVVGLEAELDKTGQQHDVLVVAQNDQYPGEAPGSSSGSSGARVSEDRTRLEYVDLETRLTIQGQQKIHLGAPANWDLATRWFGIQSSDIEGLEHQGKTLQLGDDFTAEWKARSLLNTFHDDMVVEDSDSVVESVERQWVADRALIEGQDAYGIRTEQRSTATLKASDRASFREFFGFDAGPTITAIALKTTWVSSASPYPLLTETLFKLKTGDHDITMQDAYAVRQDFQPGSGRDVPWGVDRAADHFRARNTSLERSPSGVPYPADGAGSKLAYPLGAAITEVRADVRLAQFQAWRQANPVHYLVSAELGPGERTTAATATHMWRLVFATTNGNGFELTTERINPSVPPVTESRGEKPTERFTTADLPDQGITIAAAERYWLQLAGERYQGKAPNFVHWGFFLPQSSGSACLSRTWSITMTSAPQLQMLEVGYSNQGSCVTQADSHDESSLTVWLDSGNLSYLHEWFIDYDNQPLGVFSTQAKELSIRSKTTPFTPRAPDIQEAAVASTSLLAAFLVLYFLPALKFVGAKGLLLLPGYAKLRKEDLLDNKIRDQILQVVRNDPGISTSDLAERVDAGWGTTVYHLGVLEKNGMVSSLVDGRYHRFFPIGIIDFSARGQLAVMKNERTKHIFELISGDPGIVQESLAQRVGISAPAAIFHLKRLEEVGMVGRVKKGRKVHYYANEKPRVVVPPDPKDSMEIA